MSPSATVFPRSAGRTTARFTGTSSRTYGRAGRSSSTERSSSRTGPGPSRRAWCEPLGAPAAQSVSRRPLLIRLAAHPPYGDDRGGQEDDGEHEGDAEEPVALALPQPVDPDPADDQRDEQDQAAEVGDDEPDVEPLWNERVREVVPVLLGVDPLGADPHQDPAGQRDREQRPVAEAQEPWVALRERQRGRAGDEAADQHHRSEGVHEQREVPAVGSNGGEHAQAHGFQIMSMMISRTTIDVRVWNRTPRDVRLSARSSAFGPVCPADWSSSAFFGPSRNASPVFRPSAAPVNQSTSAMMIQASQTL